VNHAQFRKLQPNRNAKRIAAHQRARPRIDKPPSPQRRQQPQPPQQRK
jgi:hypothetical protein